MSTARPNISLILPCYNVPEEQVRRALGSVRRQNFRNYEVILVDDGSQAVYAEVLRQLSEEAEHITLIRTENRGVSSARNTGVSLAQGEYIAFLDADDVLADDFMERTWGLVQETGAEMIIGGVTLTDDPGRFRPLLRAEHPQAEHYDRNMIPALLPAFICVRCMRQFTDGYISRGPVARLVRADCAREVPFDESLRIGEDINWNIQLLQRCNSICVVPESWYGYWRNPDSASRRYDPTVSDACATHLIRLGQLLNLSDREVYTAYTEHIYEHLRLVWFNYLETERRRSPDIYRQYTRRLYQSDPWRELGSSRFFASGGTRNMLVSLLFRSHLFFTAMALNENRPGKAV